MDSGWRLGHRPALDGLRGVAVILVVFAHLFTTPLAFAWMGHAGVTMFFVLSGFLITSLLQEELGATGRIRLRSFYERRARRLAPAFVVVVGVVLALSLAWPRYADWLTLIGAVTWSTNWITISQSHVLALRYTHPHPLGHTWSLSIEEQFYLLWPLIVSLLHRFGRNVLFTASLAGLAASAALPLTLVHNTNHIQYGTDTRAASLLMGCALALWMHGREERRSRRGAPAILLMLITLVTWLHASIYRVEDQLVSLLTAAIIWQIAQGEPRTFLNAAWLRLTGKRSYALYLWHVPIFWIVALSVSHAPWALALIGIPCAWTMSTLSWRFVERPFRSPQVDRPPVRQELAHSGT